jgi:hypothetical protein
MYEIDLQTRTLYAELLEQMQILEASRTISRLKGSFSIKVVNNDEYVYFQHYQTGGQLVQLYVGKRCEQTEAIMLEHAEARGEAQDLKDSLRRLSAQVKAGLGMVTDKSMSRVILGLADAGVFRNGGVLIGTHAFQAIGVMLGKRWPSDSMATSDVDIAAEKKLSIALPPLPSDIPAALESLKMGFLPVPRLSHKEPSTTYSIRKSRLRLDILTPKTGASDAPVFIRRFNCSAAPLPYLSYLVEEPVQGMIVDTEPVLVNIPQPVRYAMHKLIVSQVRDVSASAKSLKDIYQAHQLLSLIKDERPGDIQPAWDNLIARGPRWKKHADAGLAEMKKRFGDIELFE